MAYNIALALLIKSTNFGVFFSKLEQNAMTQNVHNEIFFKIYQY